MAEVIRMPRLSDTMEEGTIISWLKKVGDKVSPGDILAEVETDKATMDLESFNEGFLLYIGVQEGVVPVDGIIAVIGEKGEDYKSLIAEDNGGPSKKTPDKPESTAPESKSAAPESTHVEEKSSASTESAQPVSGMIKASPLAKKIAEDKNIDLSRVEGSGEGGRIVKRDVENITTTSAQPRATDAPVSIQITPGKDTEVEVSSMRKTIAKRLSQSKFGAPHFYLTIEANMDKAVSARKEINSGDGGKISFNDIIVKAAAFALRKHPMVNGSWMESKIVLHGDINIGVAVAVEEGLVVPVIKNADYKGLSQINAEVKDLAGKARDKSIKLDQMQGNTFTISNLGMFGIEEFTAIINPPDSCILAVGAIIQKPIAKDGQIVIGNMMKMTLSCDHRVVDGAKGAAFLQTLKAYLENPMAMLV